MVEPTITIRLPCHLDLIADLWRLLAEQPGQPRLTYDNGRMTVTVTRQGGTQVLAEILNEAAP